MLTVSGVEMEGWGLGLCLEWKLGGVFGLLTGVKGLINTHSSQISPF